jgi:hypothetical protein
LSAVCLWPHRYGQTVRVSAAEPTLKEWIGVFDGQDDPDELCTVFDRKDLYFGPPDVCARLGL